MFFKIWSVDEDVIHIDRYISFSYEICEYRVHEGLKGSRTVGHSEVHDFGFVETSISHYGSLPFVSFLDSNVMIPPSDIELSEIPSLRQPIDNVGSKRERVTVFDRD